MSHKLANAKCRLLNLCHRQDKIKTYTYDVQTKPSVSSPHHNNHTIVQKLVMMPDLYFIVTQLSSNIIFIAVFWRLDGSSTREYLRLSGENYDAGTAAKIYFTCEHKIATIIVVSQITPKHITNVYETFYKWTSFHSGLVFVFQSFYSKKNTYFLIVLPTF